MCTTFTVEQCCYEAQVSCVPCVLYVCTACTVCTTHSTTYFLCNTACTVCTILPVQVLYVLHCTALYCTVLHCTALYCTVPHCIALYVHTQVPSLQTKYVFLLAPVLAASLGMTGGGFQADLGGSSFSSSTKNTKKSNIQNIAH